MRRLCRAWSAPITQHNNTPSQLVHNCARTSCSTRNHTAQAPSHHLVTGAYGAALSHRVLETRHEARQHKRGVSGSAPPISGRHSRVAACDSSRSQAVLTHRQQQRHNAIAQAPSVRGRRKCGGRQPQQKVVQATKHANHSSATPISPLVIRTNGQDNTHFQQPNVLPHRTIAMAVKRLSTTQHAALLRDFIQKEQYSCLLHVSHPNP